MALCQTRFAGVRSAETTGSESAIGETLDLMNWISGTARGLGWCARRRTRAREVAGGWAGVLAPAIGGWSMGGSQMVSLDRSASCDVSILLEHLEGRTSSMAHIDGLMKKTTLTMHYECRDSEIQARVCPSQHPQHFPRIRRWVERVHPRPTRVG